MEIGEQRETGRSRPYSSGIGSLTFSTSSAAPQTSSAGPSPAPAAAYSSSRIPLPAPAPRSTSTRWPASRSAAAPAGVSADALLADLDLAGHADVHGQLDLPDPCQHVVLAVELDAVADMEVAELRQPSPSEQLTSPPSVVTVTDVAVIALSVPCPLRRSTGALGSSGFGAGSFVTP